MPRATFPTVTIGEIQYPNASPGSPILGGLFAGFHCRECLGIAASRALGAIAVPRSIQEARLSIIRLLPTIAPDYITWSESALCALFLGHPTEISDVFDEFAAHPVLLAYQAFLTERTYTNLLAIHAVVELVPAAAIVQVFVCRDCEEEISYNPYESNHIRWDDGHIGDGDPNLCQTCLSRYYWWSPRPARYYGNDENQVMVEGISGPVSEEYAQSHFHYDDDSGEWRSEEFGEEQRMSLLNYSADPFDHFSWDLRNRRNALVFGVELEMEPTLPNERNQRGLVSAIGSSIGKNFILKSDGSLSYGVELVTMPFTLAQHLDGTGVDWKAIAASVKGKARSGVGTDTCGIHIHINKQALSALTVGKMLVFLNAPGLASLVTSIAQRSNSSYCTRSSKKLTDGTRSSQNRYDIMNVSVRHPTCEVRMFKGNLTVERIYKNLEFCHALVQYCRQSSMRSLTEWGNFSQWLIKNRGIYPHLTRFLIDQNVVGFRQLARDSRDGQVAIVDL